MLIRFIYYVTFTDLNSRKELYDGQDVLRFKMIFNVLKLLALTSAWVLCVHVTKSMGHRLEAYSGKVPRRN